MSFQKRKAISVFDTGRPIDKLIPAIYAIENPSWELENQFQNINHGSFVPIWYHHVKKNHQIIQSKTLAVKLTVARKANESII